jgi:hypothetical protein
VEEVCTEETIENQTATSKKDYSEHYDCPTKGFKKRGWGYNYLEQS